MGALVAAVKMNTVESLVLNESLRETEYQPEEVEMSTIFKIKFYKLQRNHVSQIRLQILSSARV